MRFFKVFLPAILLSVVVFPRLSFSEVKISLRNGREIIADWCKASNGKLSCQMKGGQFEIDKKDVSNLKEIEGKRMETAPGQGEGGAAGDKQTSAEKRVEEAAGEGGEAAYQKRLDEIDQRKRELVYEREGLIQERERLNREFSGKGDVLGQEVFDSYQKRFNEIEARITSFNQENRKLNEEERAILKESGGTTEGMK